MLLSNTKSIGLLNFKYKAVSKPLKTIKILYIRSVNTCPNGKSKKLQFK